MHALTKHEVLLVSGGDDTVGGIPFPLDGDPVLPPYIHYQEDPLPPVRRQPVSRNPLP